MSDVQQRAAEVIGQTLWWAHRYVARDAAKALDAANLLADPDTARLADDLRRECDAVGVPHDAAMLVKHHRNNGKMIGAGDALRDTARQRRLGEAVEKLRARQSRSPLVFQVVHFDAIYEEAEVEQ